MLIGMLLSMSSCSAMSRAKPVEELDASKNYRMDLDIRIGDLPFKGTAVVDSQENYLITVNPVEKSEYMILNTCHREEVLRPNKNGAYITNFFPNAVERTGFCPISLTVFAAKLWYQGATILPNNDAYTLPAVSQCNGEATKDGGITLCQSKSGLIQRVTFPVPVVTATDAKAIGNNTYEFRPISGVKVYLFREQGGKREHLVTTYGYDSFTNPR